MIPLWSIPIATVTGNTLIIKPSERDPGAAMILAELAVKAGLPPGVVNIVHGAAKTVDFILDDPTIKAISFVGSNKAGEGQSNDERAHCVWEVCGGTGSSVKQRGRVGEGVQKRSTLDGYAV